MEQLDANNYWCRALSDMHHPQQALGASSVMRSGGQVAFLSRLLSKGFLIVCLLTLVACAKPEPPADERYADSDRLFERLLSNLSASETLERIVEIDHSRLGAEAGSSMSPARVVIFSDTELESRLVQLNPLVAVDLPLRVLAYESVPDARAKVIYNTFKYLQSRYELGDQPELAELYQSALVEALDGIPAEELASFASNTMQPDGIITLDSPFDPATTVERLRAAITAQDDTVWFGEVDFQARARAIGIDVADTMLLLFGGPAPGAKAMSQAPTLGLDAFCQKVLVWKDSDGKTKVSYNDLLALADRQNVDKSLALRVISRRLASTFDAALDAG